MNKTARLTLERTYLYVKNDVCIRYEVYLDKAAHPHFVVLILVIQEDEASRSIVDKINFDWQSEQNSGFQRQVQASMNPGPLQIATSHEYCSSHFEKSYS